MRDIEDSFPLVVGSILTIGLALMVVIAIGSCHARDVAKACVAAGSSWDGRECRAGGK